MDEARDHGLPRWVEVVAASVATVALAPLLAMVAAAIALSSPGPVLFRHRRCGREGRPFDLLKFRTMRPGSSGPSVTARGDSRITPIGRVLRRTKIDELPELWNVIRGDMSLVGPRPEAVAYANLAHPLWARVLSVRPGITDPMTLRLRNEEDLLARAADAEAFYTNHLLPFKLAGYAEYIASRTWRQDVAVIGHTLIAIVLPWRAPAPSPLEIESITRRAAASHSRKHATAGDTA